MVEIEANSPNENDPKNLEKTNMTPEEKIALQQELIDLYEGQIADLTMMSKIELGDDVIDEIKRLKSLIHEQIR